MSQKLCIKIQFTVLYFLWSVTVTVQQVHDDLKLIQANVKGYYDILGNVLKHAVV